jgi:hypothetical protein
LPNEPENTGTGFIRHSTQGLIPTHNPEC